MGSSHLQTSVIVLEMHMGSMMTNTMMCLFTSLSFFLILSFCKVSILQINEKILLRGSVCEV